MWESILNAGVGLHVVWGIGLLGAVLYIVANIYMNSMVRGSENMATTKKKSLRVMRQKYENGRALGINNGDSQAYVEKSIRKLRFIAAPLEVWRHAGIILCYITGMVVAGGFIYYDVSWRGSPEMIMFVANSILVIAFLRVIDNIFSINNKIEILKANIRDYLDNVSFGRELKSYGRVRAQKEAAADKEDGELDNGKMSAKKSVVKEPSRENIDSDETLDGFLKEFFS